MNFIGPRSGGLGHRLLYLVELSQESMAHYHS
jgi:hypothetical protein